MFLILVLGVNEDVIKVHYHENVELFCYYLIGITLEYSRYIGQFERHNLVLEVAIAGPKGRLLFVTFSHPHSMVSIG